MLPVGSVYGSDMVLGEEVEAMDELGRGDWFTLTGQVTIEPGAARRSSFTLTLRNPTDRDMRLSAKLSAGEGWTLDRDALPADHQCSRAGRISAS